jgi:PAS domain S-box-containing protein
MIPVQVTGSIENLQIFHGQPELVNFPSAAEIFHAVFENNFYASCIANGQGQTLEANEKFCKIFGYTSREMIRLSTKELFDVKADSYFKYLIERNLQGKARAGITGIRKSGEHFECMINSIIFNDDHGERRTMNSIQDISKNYLNIFFG